MTLTTPTAALPQIELSAPVNLRDMGGIPICGGVLREGFAIRADDLTVLTEDVADELVAQGLTAVIDLRTNAEAAITGRGPLAARPVTYHHLPLMQDIGERRDDRPVIPMSHEQMGEMYVQMVEESAAQLSTALSIIALSPGATAFHCAAGRDRTGVLAAMILLALGADDDVIVTDYARTQENMTAVQARMRPVMGMLLARLGFDLDEVSSPLLSDEPMDISMHTMLALLRERHGDPLAPLRQAGLTDATVAALRDRARG